MTMRKRLRKQMTLGVFGARIFFRCQVAVCWLPERTRTIKYSRTFPRWNSIICHSHVCSMKGTERIMQGHFEMHRMKVRKTRRDVFTLSVLCGSARTKGHVFLPHNAPCRLFLVLRRRRRMKEQPQRKECGSCCGLRGSWVSRCGGRVSAFWHWVAPGVHDSESVVGGWVKGGENG